MEKKIVKKFGNGAHVIVPVDKLGQEAEITFRDVEEVYDKMSEDIANQVVDAASGPKNPQEEAIFKFFSEGKDDNDDSDNEMVEEKSQANPQNEKEFKEVIDEIDSFVEDVGKDLIKDIDEVY